MKDKSRGSGLVVKPAWVHHEGGCVYSIDMHPGEQKFATGGQLGKDQTSSGGVIVVWSLNYLVKKEFGSSDHGDHMNTEPVVTGEPALLCRIDVPACVNCVRFSRDGRLAAAKDGGDVWIYKVGGRINSAGSFGVTAHNVEQWKLTNRLRGHSDDVLHCEWSPTDDKLASCGIDHQIVVWDMDSYEIVTTLRDHSEAVKGLSWDPTGRTLASQSDDMTVKFWGTSTWQCLKTVTEPFLESGRTTMMSRLSWSADGSVLVAPNSMNAGAPVAKLIVRRDYNCERDLVGHSKAVCCARHGRRLFESPSPVKGKTIVSSLLALGSRDRGISVWMVDQRRAGHRRPIVALENLFDDSVVDLAWSIDCRQLLVCSRDGTIACVQLRLEEIGVTPLDDVTANEHMKRLHGAAIKNASVNYTAPASGFDSEKTIIESAGFMNVMTAMETSKSPIDVKVNNSVSKATLTGFASKEMQSASASTPASTKQVETKSSDGRRRIQPVFLGSTLVLPSKAATEQNSSYQVPQPASIANKTVEKRPSSAESTENSQEPAQKKARALKKKKHGAACSTTLNKVVVSPAPSSSPPPNILVSKLAPTATCSHRLPAASVESNQIRTAADRHGLVFTAYSRVKADGMLGESVTNLVCSRFNKTRWTAAVCSWPAVAVTFGSSFVAVACSDATVRVADKNSGRMELNLLLDGAIHCLTSSADFLFAVTSNASCYLWNLATKSCLMSRVKLTELLLPETGEQPPVEVTCSRILEDGAPLLTATNGRSFTYSLAMSSWVLLSDKRDVLERLCGESAAAAGNDEPLNSLLPLKGTVARRRQLTEAAKTTAERRLQQALETKLAVKFVEALTDYTRLLLKDGDQFRLRSLLEEVLLGKNKNHSERLLGLSRTELVQEMLALFHINPAMQRIYVEFSDKLAKEKTP